LKGEEEVRTRERRKMIGGGEGKTRKGKTNELVMQLLHNLIE